MFGIFVGIFAKETFGKGLQEEIEEEKSEEDLHEEDEFLVKEEEFDIKGEDRVSDMEKLQDLTAPLDPSDKIRRISNRNSQVKDQLL